MLAAAGPSLLVGVRPSVDLKFTPLISTSNGGRSWSDGLVTKGLAARPDTLATTGGHALALVSSSAGGQVLADAGGISTWRTLVTYDDLAEGAAGKSCGLGSFTSVGYLRAQPIIGGSCVHAGVVGLFAEARHLAAGRPSTAAAVRRGRAEVLGLGTSQRTTVALVAVTGASGTELLAAWSGPGAVVNLVPTGHWPKRRSGLVRGWPRERCLCLAARGPSAQSGWPWPRHGSTSWQQLPPPPPRTATVAFGPSAPPDALVANGTKFSAWSLKAGSKRWAEDQVMDVAIQYGSSS